MAPRPAPATVLFWLVAVVALGAFAFGLWHVVVGGLLNGNSRAAAFGITLAATAGAFVGGLLFGRRAWRRRT